MRSPARVALDAVPRRRQKILAVTALLVALTAVLCPQAVLDGGVPGNPHLCTPPGADDFVGEMVAQWETARAVDKSRHGYVLADLPSAGHSLWQCIQDNGRDAAYTEFLGLDHAGFTKLEQVFTPLFNAEVHRRKPKGSNRGRPRRMHGPDVLALTLQYLRDGIDQKHFQGDFGSPRSNVARDIRLGLDVLQHALLTFETARVEWPDHVQMEEYVQQILYRHPDLAGRRIFGYSLKPYPLSASFHHTSAPHRRICSSFAVCLFSVVQPATPNSNPETLNSKPRTKVCRRLEPGDRDAFGPWREQRLLQWVVGGVLLQQHHRVRA
jgi:hypothetical protein